MPLHGVAIKADDLREHVAGEHRCPRRLFLQDDLEQDAAREVVLGLRVLHAKRHLFEHQFLDVGERDVAARLGVVQPPVRILS